MEPNKDQDSGELLTADQILEKLHSLPSAADLAKTADETAKNAPKPDTSAPNYVPAAGAAAGALGAYKGVGLDFLSPHKSIFAPKPIETGSAHQLFSVTPEEFAAHAKPPQAMTDVEHMMQSGQGTREGVTGRQRESAHNWETNRQALAAKENLAKPGASKIIIEAGPLAPTKSGIAVPQNVALELEKERMLQEARAKVQRDVVAEAAKRKAAEEAAKKMMEDKKAAESAAKWAGYGSGAAKIGLGALGGAMSAKDLYEAINDMRTKGVNDENIAKAVGGVGGGLMAIPTPLTEIIGGTMLGGSMAWPHVREHLGFTDKH